MEKLFSRGFGNRPLRKEDAPVLAENITLDPEQDAIVHSAHRNIVVVAGAGSGKTRVLTERVKHLLDTGVSPHNIVAITFTNLAADEMKHRLIGVKGIGDVFIGTIHSFANRVMKNSGEDYTLYTNEIDNEFMDYLIGKYAKYLTAARYLKFKDLHNDMETGKVSERTVQGFFSPSEAFEHRMFHRQVEMIPLETEYPESVHTLSEERGVITFDELLQRAKVYFESISAKVEHVLVDEFQDVGTLEYDFIMGLNSDNYFVIGDDWQSIYGFKGANVGLFMKLVRNEGFTAYFLTNNYRNSPDILELAETVISQVPDRIRKDVCPIREEKGHIEIATRPELVKYLTRILNEGNYGEWFILTRSNKELWEIANTCARMQIPYVTFKREGMSLSDLNRAMKSDKVKLLTVHTSKGLEAKNVLLYGRFPIRCPSYSRDTEERRVLYVGITRAKDNLVILN